MIICEEEYEKLLNVNRYECAKYGIGKHDADDITQDALIKIFKDTIEKDRWFEVLTSTRGNWINKAKRNREYTNQEIFNEI